MNDINKMTYPDMMEKFRERRNESEILKPTLFRLGQSFDPFKKVQSCLSIGPGYGEFDLEFMKSCLPNLKKVVAVEKDHNCANKIRANIHKVYNGTLDYEVIEADINDFQPKQNEKFDIVIAFHMLYHLEDRRKIIKSILDEWIEREKGFLVTLMFSDMLDANQQPINAMQNICRYLKDKIDLFTSSDDIRMDLEVLGGKVIKMEKYRCSFDCRVFDEDITQLFNMFSQVNIDSDTMKKAVEAAVPTGLGSIVSELLVIKKKLQ